VQTETGIDYQPTSIPRLIPEIEIMRFDTSERDQKYLLVHPNGRRWQISEALHTIVTHIDGASTTAEIAERVSKDTNCAISAPDVSRAIWGFLSNIKIVEDPVRPYVHFREVYTEARRQQTNLTLRINLLPVRVLDPATAVLQYLFNRWIGLLVAVTVFGIQAAWFTRNPQAFYPEWRSLRGPDWMLVLGLLYASYFIHEFGHLAACKWMGARHGPLGFGVYLVFPRLFADLTDTWRLSRSERVVIDIAGVYFQSAFAAALMVAHMTNHRPAYLMAAAVIDLTALENLNPFFKLDGYWLLSDAFGVANLDQKARWLLDSGLRNTFNFDSKTLAFICCYFVATVGFSTFILYRVAVYIPHLLVNQYPLLVLRFWRSLGRAASSHRVGPAVTALFRLLAPTGMIVGIFLMTYRYLKRAVETLTQLRRRFQ
jgi:putative peptide zinc metalloprotease protein